MCYIANVRFATRAAPTDCWARDPRAAGVLIPFEILLIAAGLGLWAS